MSSTTTIGRAVSRLTTQLVASDAASSLFQSNPCRLLIVDDQRTDRKLTRTVVETIEVPIVQLLEASSMAEALAYIEADSVDVCICDFYLGKDETALDLYRAARHRGFLMPFVAVTGQMDEETTAHRLLMAGFDDVITKADLQLANIYRIVRNAWLRNEHTRQLVEKATIDELTGVINRRGALLRLEVECVRAQRLRLPVAIIFLDLNGFKSINDRYGHQVGDLALVHFSNLLTAVARKADVVARLGGDEFVLIMAGATKPMAESMIMRTQFELAAAPLEIGTERLTLSVSAGASVFHGRSERFNTMELLKQADNEMYRSKARLAKSDERQQR